MIITGVPDDVVEAELVQGLEPGRGDLDLAQDRVGLLRDYIAGWMDSLRSPATRENYLRDLRRWMEWCAQEGLDPLRVRRRDVDRYARWLQEPVVEGQGGVAQPRYSPATTSRRLSSIGNFYEYVLAVEDERSDDARIAGSVYTPLLARNPVRGVRRPYVDADGSPRVGLSRAEARAIAQAAREHSPRAFALVMLLLNNGLRIGEALAMQVEHLHQDGPYVMVMLPQRKGGKRGRARLNEPTMQALASYIKERRSGLVFITRTGHAWGVRHAQRTIKSLCVRAGLPPYRVTQISPHTGRHFFVTDAYERGVPEPVISAAAGHTRAETTRRYHSSRYHAANHPAVGLEEVFGDLT